MSKKGINFIVTRSGKRGKNGVKVVSCAEKNEKISECFFF